MRSFKKKGRKMAAGLLVLACVATAAWSNSSVEAAEVWDEEFSILSEGAGAELQEMAEERDIMAVVYMSDEYPIRENASHDSNQVVMVSSGQTVFVQNMLVNENLEEWCEVLLYVGETEYRGYIPREYLACSDERFLAWEEEYGIKSMIPFTFNLEPTSSPESLYEDVEQFPESYQEPLKALKDQHPNWIFVPMKTGLDWNTVIDNELVGGKSLVYKTFPEHTKEGPYDDGNWFYASRDILEVYMDPRNSLTEEAIFQFEQLTYNATYHTEAALENFLSNTFMKGDKNAPGTVMTHAHIIWAVGKEKGREVSPFHLASRIYQEQGNGTSALISGTYPGYEGYYNYFNVGASGKTTQEVIENGLKYAKDKNWNSSYYSILGGADIISANYIRKGQDTLYLQKYNVNPNGYYALYTHQYMQNISAPTSEAKSIRNLYRNANALDSPFVFKIPVYENMPEEACESLPSSTKVVLQIPEGYDSTVYIDGVAKMVESRNGRVIVEASDATAQSAVVYKYNELGVPVGMYVWTLDYENGTYRSTAQPELADLLTYHGFSIRITGKSGIRFKTGISVEVREKLLSTGVDGYKIKEYGTLVMNNANRTHYPMILGGEKVLSGLSYGANGDGTVTDKIYETVNDRHRYTSVLVGLPADQYKVEYAFRGYIVLEKNGVLKTVYGPIVAKSIYALAQQVLNAGTYEQGSEADSFLRQLIADADALE